MNKKLRQLNRSDIKHIVKMRKKGEPDERLNDAIQKLPQITNETVAEHREELLSKARRYIYPLEHPRRRVLIWSASILAAAIVVFFIYSVLALYSFKSNSTFTYRISQVIPFPIAKAGPRYVAYENYLFELRHYIHYYSTQQQVNFASKAGKLQLDSFKKQAMNQVVDDAYIKQLASQYHISVSNKELNQQVDIVRNQNKLGSNHQELDSVLSEFWGWTLGDFKRELKSQILAQKVVSRLDTDTHARANKVLGLIQSGQDFGKLAKEYSDDKSTKDSGGKYDFVITQSSNNLAPQVTTVLNKLKAGQTSNTIDTGYSLEIVKVLSDKGGKITAAHISFNFKDINTYLKPLEKKNPPHYYVNLSDN